MDDDWRKARHLGPYESAAVLLTLSDAVLQSGPHDCGEAAVRTLLAFEGVVARAKFACQIDGTDARTLEGALRQIGLRVTSGEMSIEDLKHFTSTQRAVICLVTFPPNASHWVVVRGVSRGRVYYHDPSYGLDVASSAEWDASWHAADDRGHARPYRRWGIAAWAET